MTAPTVPELQRAGALTDKRIAKFPVPGRDSKAIASTIVVTIQFNATPMIACDKLRLGRPATERNDPIIMPRRTKRAKGIKQAGASSVLDSRRHSSSAP